MWLSANRGACSRVSVARRGPVGEARAFGHYAFSRARLTTRQIPLKIADARNTARISSATRTSPPPAAMVMPTISAPAMTPGVHSRRAFILPRQLSTCSPHAFPAPLGRPNQAPPLASAHLIPSRRFLWVSRRLGSGWIPPREADDACLSTLAVRLRWPPVQGSAGDGRARLRREGDGIRPDNVQNKTMTLVKYQVHCPIGPMDPAEQL